MAFSKRIGSSMKRFVTPQLTQLRCTKAIKLPHAQATHCLSNNTAVLQQYNISNNNPLTSMFNKQQQPIVQVIHSHGDLDENDEQFDSDYEEQDFDLNFLLNHAQMCKDGAAKHNSDKW